ncbi:MAG: hypothetical protein V4714_12180 [Bacteroidota bacterium]
MFKEKVKNRESGILLYGITPPKAQNAHEKNQEISQKRMADLLPLPIDGLVIYDLQDESHRTAQERPFPFLPTLDPHVFASDYLKELPIPKIIYGSVGKFSKPELSSWISTIQQSRYSAVFVGAPSKDQVAHMKLPEAYEIWRQENKSAVLGGVMIPERHHSGRSEHMKIVHKMDAGCSFFISQCVYSIGYTKNVLSDLYFYCQVNQLPLPTLIFTLTTCGSVKTIDFMNWLGIHIPIWLRNELTNCQDILSTSVDLCLDLAEEIIEFCIAKSIPFGFNIESVSIRKDEIDASLYLLNQVDQLLQASGVRKVTKAATLIEVPNSVLEPK